MLTLDHINLTQDHINLTQDHLSKSDSRSGWLRNFKI